MRTHLINGLGLVLALTTSALLSQVGSGDPVDGDGPADDSSGRKLPAIAAGTDTTRVEDADGVAVLAADYSRIVSLNPVADHLLLRLVEADRLVGISSVTDNGHPERWRFGQTEVVARADSLERVFTLRPDLVVASPFVDVAKVARLRANGIHVFNLGEMRGIETTLKSIDALGALLQVPERRASLRLGLERDLQALEASAAERLKEHGEVRGLYLSVYGDSFFGGTSGTSYGDVLRLAGIQDVAERAGYVDWPQYTAEQVLLLDPEVLVTRRGMEDAIRAHPVLGRLRAARVPHRILPLDPAYDGDAGLGVIEAASGLQSSLEQLLQRSDFRSPAPKHD